jgi:PST family polysaccharide transporter
VLSINLACNKILAINIGVAGIGELSVIKQLYLFLASPAIGAQSAIVQGIAFIDEAKSKGKYVVNSLIIFISILVLVSALVFYFSSEIAWLVFKNKSIHAVHLVELSLLPTLLCSLYFFLKSVMNGFHRVGTTSTLDVLGAAVLLMSILYISILDSDIGIMYIYAISLSQAVLIVFNILFIWKYKISRLFFVNKKIISIDYIKYFLNFSAASILSGFLSVLVILWVRIKITQEGGYIDAGLFDLSWTLSASYVMLLLGPFSTYYMPKLTSMARDGGGDELIKNVLKLSIALMTPLIILVIMLKPALIVALYSKDFLSAIPLMCWLLIGDYLKITSWALGLSVVSKGNMKYYFISEISWSIGLFILLNLIFSIKYSLESIGAIVCLLYLGSSFNYLYYVFKNFKNAIDLTIIKEWLIGLSMVLLASYIAWGAEDINLKEIFAVEVLAISFSIFIFVKKQYVIKYLRDYFK